MPTILYPEVFSVSSFPYIFMFLTARRVLYRHVVPSVWLWIEHTIFEFRNLQESSEGSHCLLFWAKYGVFRKYIYNFALSKHFVDHLDTNIRTTKERMGKKVKRKERERGRERKRERKRDSWSWNESVSKNNAIYEKKYSEVGLSMRYNVLILR